MSIQRGSNASSEASARQRPVDRAEQALPPAPDRAIDAFREALLQARARADDVSAHQRGLLEAGEEAASQGARTDGRDTERRELPQAEAQAVQLAQAAASAGTAASTGAGGPDPQAFAALLERHVRQMMVSEGGLPADGSGEVVLRLDEATLPGTDLMLQRDGARWTLQVASDNRASIEAVNRFFPQLAERFSERRLGELSVQVSFRNT